MTAALYPEAMTASGRQPPGGGSSPSRARLVRRAAAATAAAAALTPLVLTAAPGQASAATAARPARTAGTGRGQLVSVTPLRTLADKAAVRAELTADGFDPAPARYGVRTFRLVYRTVSASGRPTTASGLLALPIGGPRRLTLVSFTHGTEAYRGDAPSMQPHGFEPAPAYTYASAGFATAEVLYAALTLVSFDQVHRIYRSPAEVFRQPYARTIVRLLSGNTPDPQIIKDTPGTLGKLLTARGLALLRHPNPAFAAELQTADSVCTDWTPAAPLRLYYATRDEQAVTANTFHCQRGFAARGVRVPVINLGTPLSQGSRHYGSNVAATARIARWFTQLTHEHSPSA